MAIKKNIKALLFIILTGIFFEGGGYLYGLRPSDIFYYHIRLEEEETTQKKAGIYFKTDILEESYPVFWKNSGIKNIEIESLLSKYEYSRFFRVLAKETKKIPENTLRENIKEIYGLSSIYFDGVFVGGTYSPKEKKIFINLQTDMGNIVPERFVREAFHHEFSSILFKNYKYNEKNWRISLPEGFLYKAEENPFYYIIEMQGNSDKISEKELYSRGLLKQYAETGVENDFNTYAEVIFTEPRKMKKLIAEHPVIKRKYEAFKAFYLSIDPGFAPVFEKIDS